MAATLWTIGHSTRGIDEFISLLQAYRITQVIDIRLLPFSRRYPHFHIDALAATLHEAAMAYRHLPLLGGRRKPIPDSVNEGWRNAGFRGYADYMQTESFRAGFKEATSLAACYPTALMCAEAVPWRCHRALVADAFVATGWEVHHIVSRTDVKIHALTSFALVQNGIPTYPRSASTDETSRLF